MHLIDYLTRKDISFEQYGATTFKDFFFKQEA